MAAKVGGGRGGESLSSTSRFLHFGHTVQSCVQRVRRHLAKDAVLRRNHAKVMQALADRLENA